MAIQPLFVFIDEGGDFNFTPSGSKVYTITATISHCPWELLEEATQIRHLILAGELNKELGQEYLEIHLSEKFHASEDLQVVRDNFYEIIQKAEYIKVHSVVVRKNRTNPSLRAPVKFYPKVIASLLDYIFKKYEYSKLCIFLDGVPIKKNKDVFLKSIKAEIRAKQPNKEFSIYFPPSCSNLYLQISDYMNWAIFRKWEKSDERSYDLIKKFLGSTELDMFSNGDMEYYQYNK